jgi:hypothetical protein
VFVIIGADPRTQWHGDLRQGERSWIHSDRPRRSPDA